MEKPNGTNLKLAMQKEGRLTDETLALLKTIGLQFEAYKQKLFAVCRNFPLDILFVRDDDIPAYVADGVVDLGIVGRNLVVEREVAVEEVLPLKFGFCSLVVAAPKDSDIHTLEDLNHAKIATSYPVTTQRFFSGKGLLIETIPIRGSVEIAPALGIAKAIVDLTATGSSLALNDLRPIARILESQAVLVAHPPSLEIKQKSISIDRLIRRIKAAQSAREYKYVMMNAPRSALQRICELNPGMKSPTVLPLAEEGWIAIHTVIKEEIFWDVVEGLHEAGAREILVSPIEKLIF